MSNGTSQGGQHALMAIIDFLTTAGTGAVTGAMLANKLQTAGLPASLAKPLANLFDVHLGGLGSQDEVNNWLALAGLQQLEALGQLPAGKTAQQCGEEWSEWAYTLLPTQKKSLVLKVGMLFGDVSGTLQPRAGATAAPADEYQIKLAAIEEAQRKAAESLLLILGAAPDHSLMTRIAIANRLIPGRDYGHALHTWWSESWAEHCQSVQSARDIRDAWGRRNRAHIDESRRRRNDPTDPLNMAIATQQAARTARRAAQQTRQQAQQRTRNIRRMRRRRGWRNIIFVLGIAGVIAGGILVLSILTKLFQ